MAAIDCGWLLKAAQAPAAQADPGEVNRVRDAVLTRARRLLRMRIRFVSHPSFHEPASATEILGPMPDPHDAEARAPESHSFSATGFPKYTALTREQERHLFRKYNFLKYRAAQLRDALDPTNALATYLDRIEAFDREAGTVRDQIICSNLPLVIFIARKWGATGHDFLELVSDGNVALLRAAERFDIARGVRFCTYAYWAIQREFARRMPKERLRRTRFATGHRNVFRALADRRDRDTSSATDQEHARNTISQLLAALDEREQRIIARRFGLADAKRTLCQLGAELGISKERVRQLECRALEKLRNAARSWRIDAP